MKTIERWVRVIGPLIAIFLFITVFNLFNGFDALTIIVSTLFPFSFSLLLAWIINPLVVKTVTTFKVKRSIAAPVIFIGIFATITLIFVLLIPEIVNQFSIVKDAIPDMKNKVIEISADIGEKINLENPGEMANNIFEKTSQYFSSFLSGGFDVFLASIAFIAGIIGHIFLFIMILIASLYMLIDFDRIEKIIWGITPKRFKKDLYYLVSEFNIVVVGYLRGLIIETFFVGIMAWIVFAILGIDGALVFGIIVGLTNIIPYLGPYIGGVPVALYALTDSLKLFVFVLIALVVIQQIDGVLIKPKVFGKTANVHPAISIIAVILFGKLFGFIGVVVAIPLAGIIIVLIKFIYSKLVLKYPDVFL